MRETSFTTKKAFNKETKRYLNICPKHKIKKTSSSTTWSSYSYSKKQNKYVKVYNATIFDREKVKGIHLINMFERNIWEQVRLKKYKLEDGYAKARYKIDKHFSVFNNLENISLLNVGDKIYEVDVDACYWSTAYILKMIDKKLYDYGFQHKEWKTGRLIAVGNMFSKIRLKEINYGVPTEYMKNAEYCTVYKTLRPLWTRIVDEVMKVGIAIEKEVSDDFLFFFTDALFVTTKKSMDKIIEMATEYGYKVKVKEHIVKEINTDGQLYLNWKKDAKVGSYFSKYKDVDKVIREFDEVLELIN